MDKQFKESAANHSDLFDEIEIHPLEDNSYEEALLDATTEKVEWVVLVEEKAEQIPPSVPESAPILERPQPEASIPTLKLDDSTMERSPEWQSSGKPFSSFMEAEKLEKIEPEPIEGPPMPPLEAKQKSSLDEEVVDVKQLLEELSSIEEKEKESGKPATNMEAADVKQLLAELSAIEEKESSKPSKPLIALAKPKKTVPLNAGDSDDIKHTLAEMSFIEGNESLAQGDRSGAIGHYRDAINYAPEKVEFYLKLSDLLSEDASAKLEAEKLLNKAIELEPSNLELRSKLAEFREEQTRKSDQGAPKKALQSLSATIGQESQPESKTGKLTPIGQKGAKPGKLARARFITVEAFQLPEKISFRNQVIIGIFLGLMIWMAIFILRGGPVKVQVKLVSPSEYGEVPQDLLELTWQAAADMFKVQVEENGELIMERVTQETRYNFSPQERALLKPDHRYTWRVIPQNQKGEVLPYVKNESQFKVLPPIKPPKPVIISPPVKPQPPARQRPRPKN